MTDTLNTAQALSGSATRQKSALSELLEFKLISFDNYNLTLYNILLVLVIWLCAALVIRIFRLFLKRAKRKKEWVDEGTSYTLLKLAKYFIYTMSIIFCIEALGFDVTLLIAGSTALFVGIGLGLQGFFTDIVSGIIILFEGTIKVGDVVIYHERWGMVRKIDLRTSKIVNRDGNVIIVPNSELARKDLINLTYSNRVTRFSVNVSTAYGSDLDAVEEIMLDAARSHPDVYKHQAPFVRMLNFGDNGLEFELLFFTTLNCDADTVRSDLRFAIARKFKEKGIEIPFPQRVVHLKSQENTPS